MCKTCQYIHILKESDEKHKKIICGLCKKEFNTEEEMKYFKIKYISGETKIVKAKNCLEVIKQYDLAARKNIKTRVIELSGEQEAIAISNKL